MKILNERIDARNAVVLWDTPSAEHPLGQVAICPIGYDLSQADYPYSGGAAYIYWRSLPPIELLASLYFLYYRLTFHYGIAPIAVDAAFQQITEYHHRMSSTTI